MERIRDEETVIMAEGYLFELERRGYLQAGAFIPEVVLEHPHVVKSVYEEFAHCGSDVILAFMLKMYTFSIVDCNIYQHYKSVPQF